MEAHKNLEKLGLELPTPTQPGGNYLSVNIRGNNAYVAVQFPIQDGRFLYQGSLGNKISTQDGYRAMQICALNVLAQIEQKVGLEKVMGLNHIDAYYRSIDGWDDAPKVVNGASDLFIQVLGDRGLHSRAILGVDQLPRGFCVGLTASFTILDQQ